MTPTIEAGFVRQFEQDVHNAYQRLGSKLRPRVRSKTDVKGVSTTFQKVGKGTASTKARHGKVPVMNVDHGSVECVLQDFYAGEWLDAMDELKVGHNEREVIVNAGAYALGRKTDELIIAALDQSGNLAGDSAEGLTKPKILAAFEMLGQADVPDDGQRTAVIGWRQWSQLLEIPEFADADYVGAEDLPWKGAQAKHWLGTLWIAHSGLTTSSNIRFCHWFHKTAIGHASGKEVESDITWHGDRAALFINNMMSQGAVLIDPAGVVTMACNES